MPQKNKADYNAYQRTYQLRRYHERMETARLVLGGMCVMCFSTDELEIDHKNAEDKNFPIAKLWSIAKKRFDEELEKCQLLCKPCHAIKSKECGDLVRGRNSIGRVANF